MTKFFEDLAPSMEQSADHLKALAEALQRIHALADRGENLDTVTRMMPDDAGEQLRRAHDAVRRSLAALQRCRLTTAAILAQLPK